MRPAALQSALLVLLTWAVVSADPKPFAKSWPGGWKARGDAGGKPGIGKHASPRTESKSPKTEAKRPVAAASKMIKGKIGKVGWQPFSKSGWKGITMNMTAAAKFGAKGIKGKGLKSGAKGMKGKGLKPAPPGSNDAAGKGKGQGRAQKKGTGTWKKAAAKMKGGALAEPDSALRMEMNAHGYFYNRTLDDFVKDINWQAGLVDSATLDGHIATMRKHVGFSKTADAVVVVVFLLIVCIVLRCFNSAAKQVLRLGIALVGFFISPCRPCLNRCGRRVFGKGYQMVNVYDPNPDELEAADTKEKLLAMDRDTEA